MTAPRGIPRSPAGLLAPATSLPMDESVSGPMSRSSSALSSSSASPLNYPGVLRRRSTDNSGGLDYYWSSLAGAGHSSSSSSLAISPSPSARALLSASAMRSRSQLSLKEAARAEAANTPPIPIASKPARQGGGAGQSLTGNPRYGPGIDTALAPPAGSSRILGGREMESPGGWSTSSSDYSNSESAGLSPLDFQGLRIGSLGGDSSDGSNYDPADYRAFLAAASNRSTQGESRRPILTASSSQDSVERARDADVKGGEPRDSVATISTYRPTQPREEDDVYHDASEKTPMAPEYQEREVSTPSQSYSLTQPHHSYPTMDRAKPPMTVQTTPTRPSPSPSASNYTPTSGRLPFTTPLETARPSPSTQLPTSASSNDTVLAPHTHRYIEPKSAPASKRDFGDLGDFGPSRSMPNAKEEEDEDTIKARNRRTLPANSSLVSAASIDSLQEASRDLLSPQKASSGTSTPERRESMDSNVARSPEPPPRSTLRPQYVPDFDSPRQTNPLNVMTRTSVDLPTIINTTHSPDASPARPRGHSDTAQPQTPILHRDEPARPDRSPSRTPMLTSSTTITDLTEMLGGAIDAIGLVDSRDTPPPSIHEVKREKSPLSLSLAPAAEVDAGPITPTSLPSRGASLPESSSTESEPMGPPALPSRHQEKLRRLPSNLSLRTDISVQTGTQASLKSPPGATFNVTPRPWPAAMLYSHIKGLKYAGDRAKGYAKGINNLSRAESGMKEWCMACSSQPNRLPMRASTSKTSTFGSLGAPSSGYSTTSTLVAPMPHQRNVSSSSEFPMRADSYTAKEIPLRTIDPKDAPDSLPPNLPYPQLQPHQQNASLYTPAYGGGGMKPSQSMQSVASFSSKKSGGGFFSHIGKKGSSKKDSASGLGPPTGVIHPNKKDIRGLAISSPTYPGASSGSSVRSGHSSTSPQRTMEEGSRHISAPMGPRGPKVGSFTPPPSFPERSAEMGGRASLDTGLSRLNHSVPGPRSSFDSTSTRSYKGSLPPTLGYQGGQGAVPNLPPRPSGLNPSADASPSADEVRSMGDILPHVSLPVIKAYLSRYGDQMQAIGMYLEDEKRGTVIKA